MAALPPPQSPTIDAIYAAYEAKRGSGFRDHLGASLIGNSCLRALWFTFRWVTDTRFNGRKLRLFETGDREETRMMADLRMAGATVLEIDPDTGRQWKVRDETGHFGGSMDGVALGLLEAPKTWHLVETKTHNLKSFNRLKSEGVQKSKPLHWAQMQVYMFLGNLDRAFYLSHCKDTDELYSERAHKDVTEGAQLTAKAATVINASVPPERISQDPAWFECRFCDHHAVCHGGDLPPANCRNCLHSTAIENGQWHCAKWNETLTSQQQRAGCKAHLLIPELVPGKQIDAAEDGSWVEYQMPNGAVWRDGSAVPF